MLSFLNHPHFFVLYMFKYIYLFCHNVWEVCNMALIMLCLCWLLSSHWLKENCEVYFVDEGVLPLCHFVWTPNHSFSLEHKCVKIMIFFLFSFLSLIRSATFHVSHIQNLQAFVKRKLIQSNSIEKLRAIKFLSTVTSFQFMQSSTSSSVLLTSDKTQRIVFMPFWIMTFEFFPHYSGYCPKTAIENWTFLLGFIPHVSGLFVF